MMNDDLISREAALNALLMSKDYRDAHDALEQLPAVDAAPTVNDWISVKDRLPEDDYECLVITEDYWYYTGWFADDIQKWIVDGGVECDEEVTHWIRLPEPPKEDD